MTHLAARHDMPVQVEDILERRTRVRREPKARQARVTRDPRRSKDKASGDIRVGQVRNGGDVQTRNDQHVEWRRAWLPIERHDVGVLEADRRGGLMGGDPAEHTVARGIDLRS